MANADGPPSTTPNDGTEARLRAKIDAGETGDKTPASDPAASPLGADNEAAEGHDEEGLATARRASGSASKQP